MLLLRLILMIIVVGLASCDSSKGISPGSSAIVKKPMPRSTGEPAAGVQSTNSTRDPRLSLQDRYRLRPDNRYLQAVAMVHRFFSGEEEAVAKYRFVDGQWLIRYGDMDVGTLPEDPDFSHVLDGLVGWTAAVRHRFPPAQHAPDPGPPTAEIEKQLERFLVPDVASAALEIDTLWRSGNHHPNLLRLATRALVAMAVQRLDSMEIADRVPAKALALLAITKACTSTAVLWEECLLSWTMGYSSHAETVAKDLPTMDAARLFVTRRDMDLQKIAKNGSGEARYLFLLRLTGSANLELFYTWMKEHFPETWGSLPILKACMDLSSFSLTPLVSEALPYIVLLDLARQLGVMPDLSKVGERLKGGMSDQDIKGLMETVHTILTAEKSTVIERFESGLVVMDQRFPGPFLDSRTYGAFYMGCFFSGLYSQGLHYLDSLSSEEAADEFAATLGTSENGLAADFQRWYRNLALCKTGKANPSDILNHLMEFPHLTAPLFMRTLREAEKYYGYGTPLVVRAIKAMVTRMDSRTQHRRYLGEMARGYLIDVKLTEKSLGSVLRSAGALHQDVIAWYADFVGERETLRGLLRSPEIGASAKARAIHFLSRYGEVSPEEIIGEYKRLVKEQPDAYDLRSSYSYYLEGISRFAESRSVMKEWLGRNVATTGLEDIYAHTLIARASFKEGNYQEGLAAIQPVVKSQQAGAMEMGALLLDAVGRKGEAEALGRAVVKRYPGALHGRITLARIYWSHGKPAEAADILRSHPHKIGIEDWRVNIAREFADVFAANSKEEMMNAFSALLQRGFGPLELLRLSLPFESRGNYEFAFEISSRVGKTDDPDVPMSVYRHLKGWKGETEALIWIKKMLTPSMLKRFMTNCYRDGEIDLLWELFQDGEKGPDAEHLWLLRTGASLRAGALDESRRQAILAYCHQSGGGYYKALTRFLMGLMTEAEVLELATNPRKICELGYYSGLLAQKEGRYEDAADWFRVSLETGVVTPIEFHWVVQTLIKWREERKCLARLAAEGL
jgi:tetratricopeptide (TPR) repeat protein